VRAIREVFARQRAEGEAQLAKGAAPHTGVDVTHFADMAYAGQIHALRVRVQADFDAAQMRDAFVEQYRAEFGNTLENIGVVVVNLRTRVVGRRGGMARRAAESATSATPQPIKRRRVYFGAWHDVRIYARSDLLPGMRFEGPAIVEQDDTTTVVEPGMATRVDRFGNLLVEMA